MPPEPSPTEGELPTAEFAFPGPLRDQLVAAILDGSKTTTTSLHLECVLEGERPPRPGDRSVVVDSENEPVAVIEVSEMRLLRLAEIDLRHVVDEGEGHRTVAEWRAGHEDFWHSAEFRASVGDPEFTVDDDTLAVAERFRLLERR